VDDYEPLKDVNVVIHWGFMLHTSQVQGRHYCTTLLSYIFITFLFTWCDGTEMHGLAKGTISQHCMNREKPVKGWSQESTALISQRHLSIHSLKATAYR